MQWDRLWDYPVDHFPGHCLFYPERYQLGSFQVLKVNNLSFIQISIYLLTVRKQLYNNF